MPDIRHRSWIVPTRALAGGLGLGAALPLGTVNLAIAGLGVSLHARLPAPFWVWLLASAVIALGAAAAFISRAPAASTPALSWWRAGAALGVVLGVLTVLGPYLDWMKAWPVGASMLAQALPGKHAAGS